MKNKIIFFTTLCILIFTTQAKTIFQDSLFEFSNKNYISLICKKWILVQKISGIGDVFPFRKDTSNFYNMDRPQEILIIFTNHSFVEKIRASTEESLDTTINVTEGSWEIDENNFLKLFSRKTNSTTFNNSEGVKINKITDMDLILTIRTRGGNATKIYKNFDNK